jgi:hypothetical protein
VVAWSPVAGGGREVLSCGGRTRTSIRAVVEGKSTVDYLSASDTCIETLSLNGLQKAAKKSGEVWRPPTSSVSTDDVLTF